MRVYVRSHDTTYQQLCFVAIHSLTSWALSVLSRCHRNRCRTSRPDDPSQSTLPIIVDSIRVTGGRLGVC